jgi:hypothetical protein
LAGTLRKRSRWTLAAASSTPRTNSADGGGDSFDKLQLQGQMEDASIACRELKVTARRRPIFLLAPLPPVEPTARLEEHLEGAPQ